jgi:hypothetical protein
MKRLKGHNDTLVVNDENIKGHYVSQWWVFQQFLILYNML